MLHNTNKKVILLLGAQIIFETVKNKIPKDWELLHIQSINELYLNPIKVEIILDASIKEIIDLELEIFSCIKIIGCASTGSNHIKGLGEKNRQIKVFTLRDLPDVLNNLTSAAEFSFGLLIALSKNLIPAVNSVKEGSWDRSKFPGLILKNKKIGIIGFGRIGKNMASYARNFKMKIGFYDPYIEKWPKNINRYLNIEKLVSESDFISLHVPYDTKSNLNPIINRKIFSTFKKGSFFINTSRGELIDESGLITELRSGRISGAALDVIASEPDLINNPLYKYSKESKTNLLLTPHIAGNSTENVITAVLAMLKHLINYYTGPNKIT